MRKPCLPIKLVGFILLFALSCKKKEQSPIITEQATSTAEKPPATEIVKEVGLSTSDGEYQLWEGIPVDTMTRLSDLKTIDGKNLDEWFKSQQLKVSQSISSLKTMAETPLSPGQALATLLSRCKRAAFEFTSRYPDVKTFHSNFPNIKEQDRLAYVWAASDTDKQHLCSEDKTETDCACSKPLYGLDCSGFVYQIFSKAGLDIQRLGTSGYADLNYWNSLFAKSGIYSGIKAVDVTKITSNYDFLEGDIIVRPGRHMGMVFDGKNGRSILNSFGKPSNTCEINSDMQHGPVGMAPNSEDLKFLFEKGYKVIRFKNVNTEYLLSASLRINLTFYGSVSNPHYGYAEYFLKAVVLDSKGQTPPGVTVTFTSNFDKTHPFDNPTMTTPNTQNRLNVPDRQFPIIKIFATMPDGTYLEYSDQPKYTFEFNQPSIVGATKIISKLQ
ncbi:hypothetical protein [Mucilaginibacter sp. HD30]